MHSLQTRKNHKTKIKMTFEDQIKQKIPKKIQKRIMFGELLSIVKNNNIKNLKQLNSFINSQIDLCRSWLAQSKTASTMSRIRREWTKKLKILITIKEKLIKRYLK